MVENGNKTKKSLGKKIRRTFTWIFLLFWFFAGSMLALLFLYEDEVKAAVISELNRHLKAEVKVDPKNIDLTILKTFPDCSIQFDDVLILEALPIKQRDTLIFAGRLNLHFNIRDLWNKKYSIEKIRLKDGVLKPRILKDGKDNYTIWEAQPKAGNKAESVSFNLELLRLENCRVSYDNKQAGFFAGLLIRSMDCNGDFKATDFVLNSDGKLVINKVLYDKSTILENKNLDFSVGLDVSDSRYRIKKAEVMLNQLLLELNGGFTYKDSLANLDLAYNAPKLDIASLISLLPKKYKDKVDDYESAGNFYARGKLRYQSAKDFLIESDFGIKDGSITYKPLSTVIKRVEIEGHLESGDHSSLLEIKNIYLKLNNDEVKGSGSIRGFSEPYIVFSGAANFDLANLQAFYPIDTLERLQGNLKFTTSIEGSLHDLREQTFSKKVKLDLNASMTKLEAKFKGDEHVFSVESGSVIAVNRQMEVQNLKFKRGSSDLLLNGSLPDFFNYFSEPGAALTITGNLFSNYIRMEDFMLKYKASGGESDLIPSNVSFKLNAAIQKFTYARFTATDIRGEIDVRHQKAIVSDMTLKTMDGEASIDAFADNSDHKLNLVLQSKLRNINISKLFTGFNNFGQTTLQDKNIKGFVSAEIDFSGSWNNKLESDLGSIRSNCALNIERGELIDFKPLVSLSKFVDLEELAHIRFSTLQSEVQIRNQLITFPKTVLKNSALNILFSGTHSFDNMIDYHIQLVISELLAKKRKADYEFGPIEEDKEKRRCAFILMTGSIDNPEKKYDRKGQRDKIREDIKQEKQNVKQVLKEVGLFKQEEFRQKDKKTEQKFELEKPDNNPPKKTFEPKKKPVEEDF